MNNNSSGGSGGSNNDENIVNNNINNNNNNNISSSDSGGKSRDNNNINNNNNSNSNNNNSINEICNQLLVKEIEWWRNDIKKEQVEKLVQLGYNPENLLFFGELTFTIKGIKPITLISEFSDGAVNQSYINKVLKVVFDKLPFMGYYSIDQLETSNCCFNNCLIVYNRNNHLYNQLNSLIKSSINNSINNSNNIVLKLKEDQLSKLLDYPFSLPENFSDISASGKDDDDDENGDIKMMDVGYQSQDKIIMSYYCTFNQLKSNRSIIENHFNKYLNKFIETFLNSDLKLKVSFT